MQTVQTSLSAINYKVRQLILLYKQERKNSEALNKEKDDLLFIIEAQKKLIVELEERNKLLNVRNSIEDSTDATAVKQKINELIREVDRCIRLLTTTD